MRPFFCLDTSSRKRRSAGVRLAIPFSEILSSTRSTSAATGSASTRRRGRAGVTAACAARARRRPTAPSRHAPPREAAAGGCAGRVPASGRRDSRRATPPTCARCAMPSLGGQEGEEHVHAHQQRTSVRARIGTGSGKTISSASGQYIANASATPSTAPEAPTIGAHAHDAGERQRESARRRHRTEVIEDERPAAHPVLDRRAEHEQHEHVAEQVQEPGVHEHVGEEGPGPLQRAGWGRTAGPTPAPER